MDLGWRGWIRPGRPKANSFGKAIFEMIQKLKNY
jgi:hypothetical protein